MPRGRSPLRHSAVVLGVAARVREADGSRTELRLRGLQANVWGWRSAGCDRSRAFTITYLRHLDNLLAVDCTPQKGPAPSP